MNNLKEINIKIRTCYYIDDIIKFEDFDLENILLDEKSYQNIFVFEILYKTFIGVKLLRIKFNKVDWFIRVYDGTRYLVLFGGEKYDFIYNRIRHLIEVKSGIKCVISHNYAKKKVDLCDSLRFIDFSCYNTY